LKKGQTERERRQDLLEDCEDNGVENFCSSDDNALSGGGDQQMVLLSRGVGRHAKLSFENKRTTLSTAQSMRQYGHAMSNNIKSLSVPVQRKVAAIGASRVSRVFGVLPEQDGPYHVQYVFAAAGRSQTVRPACSEAGVVKNEHTKLASGRVIAEGKPECALESGAMEITGVG
jgi:hypothetical protein